MLRWSGQEEGLRVDLDELGAGAPPGEQRWGRELHEFASAAVELDEDALDRARAALVAVAGEAVMVDAAAVAANFEMMTRLADGTGARFPIERDATNAPIVAAMGMGDATSRR